MSYSTGNICLQSRMRAERKIPISPLMSRAEAKSPQPHVRLDHVDNGDFCDNEGLMVMRDTMILVMTPSC